MRLTKSNPITHSSLDPDNLLQFIYGLANDFVSDARMHEELVQETLLMAYPSVAVCDTRKSSLDAWLYSMVRSCFIELIKKKDDGKYTSEEIILMLDKSLQQSNSKPCEHSFADLKKVLQRLLAALPSHQREAFVMVHVKRLGLQEAANHMGVSTEALKSRLKRAKRKLRAHIKQRMQ